MQDILNTKEMQVAMISAIAAIIAAAVAAIATVVGPLVTTRISRRQTVSTLRQQWIDRLREDISEFLSLINHYLLYTEIPLETEDEQRSYRRLLYLEAKIQMMVNPKEEDHLKLIELIGLLITTIHGSKSEEKRMDIISTNHNKLIALSQQILKREWERVKNE